MRQLNQLTFRRLLGIHAFTIWHLNCSTGGLVFGQGLTKKREDVFTTIRHYRVKLGQADQAIRLTEVELVPVVSALPGFVAYQALLVGPQAMATISTYRDREAADSANSFAADWVEKRLDSVVDGPAEVTVGQVRISMSGVSDNAPA